MGTETVLVTVRIRGAHQQFDLSHTGARRGSNVATCQDASRSLWDLSKISSTVGPKLSMSNYQASQASAKNLPLETGDLQQRAGQET
ncbi:UNVERIFIED_CONTAM: hypothetical protein FKN15_015288 [Acipenser sinensis]